jgi:hypothetical protein
MKADNPTAEDMVPRALLEEAMEQLYLIGNMESQIPARDHLDIMRQSARDAFVNINIKLGDRAIRMKP